MKKRKEEARMKLFSARLDTKLIDRLKIRAVKEHTTVQALVAQAIEALLKQQREEGDQ
jgi:predicted transcriptional regulator